MFVCIVFMSLQVYFVRNLGFCVRSLQKKKTDVNQDFSKTIKLPWYARETYSREIQLSMMKRLQSSMGWNALCV